MYLNTYKFHITYFEKKNRHLIMSFNRAPTTECYTRVMCTYKHITYNDALRLFYNTTRLNIHLTYTQLHYRGISLMTDDDDDEPAPN